MRTYAIPTFIQIGNITGKHRQVNLHPQVKRGFLHADFRETRSNSPQFGEHMLYRMYQNRIKM